MSCQTPLKLFYINLVEVFVDTFCTTKYPLYLVCSQTYRLVYIFPAKHYNTFLVQGLGETRNGAVVPLWKPCVEVRTGKDYGEHKSVPGCSGLLHGRRAPGELGYRGRTPLVCSYFSRLNSSLHDHCMLYILALNVRT